MPGSGEWKRLSKQVGKVSLGDQGCDSPERALGGRGMPLVIRPLSSSSRATREVKQRFDCWEHIKVPAWGQIPSLVLPTPPTTSVPKPKRSLWLDGDASAAGHRPLLRGSFKRSSAHLPQLPFKRRKRAPAGQQDPREERQGCDHGLGSCGPAGWGLGTPSLDR